MLLDTDQSHHSPVGAQLLRALMMLAFGLVVIGTYCTVTLSGVLEVVRLEPTGEGRGVDDIYTILAVVLPVTHDGHYKDCHSNGPSSKT